MRLSELIGLARELKGWTLRDLERASGVSNALISQIETGKVKNPRFVTVVRLVDALGITLDRAATAERAKFDVLCRLLPDPGSECPECHKYAGKCPHCHRPRPSPAALSEV